MPGLFKAMMTALVGILLMMILMSTLGQLTDTLIPILSGMEISQGWLKELVSMPSQMITMFYTLPVIFIVVFFAKMFLEAVKEHEYKRYEDEDEF